MTVEWKDAKEMPQIDITNPEWSFHRKFAFIDYAQKQAFICECPREISFRLRQKEYDAIEKRLKALRVYFDARYRPLGYFKQQRNPWWFVTIDVSNRYFQKAANINVLSFRSTYGKVGISGFERRLDFSCSGGTVKHPNFTWENITRELSIEDENGAQAMLYLLDRLEDVKKGKVVCD